MTPPPPSAQYWVKGADSAKVSGVTDRLRRLGIECIPATETSSGARHVLVFLSAVSEELLQELATIKSSPTLCLCVIVGDAKVPSAHVWQLLQAGANDVVTDSDGDAVDQIAARLERWHTVDGLLRSAAVTDTLIGTSPSWQRLLRQVVEVAAFTLSARPDCR